MRTILDKSLSAAERQCVKEKRREICVIGIFPRRVLGLRKVDPGIEVHFARHFSTKPCSRTAAQKGENQEDDGGSSIQRSIPAGSDSVGG